MAGRGRGDEGVASTLEIVVALLIFVLVLASYFTVLGQTFRPLERDLASRNQAVLLSTMLLSEPGHLDDNTTGGNTSWEAFPASGTSMDGNFSIHDNLTGLGFAREGGGYGVIDRDKVEAMRKVRYEQARTVLGLDELDLHFHLRVREPGGEVVLDYGPEPRQGTSVQSFRRVASMVQVNTSVVPVDFPVSAKLVINEIMWHPVDAAEGGNEHAYEWIELFNPNPYSVDVQDWHLLNDLPADKANQEPSDDNQLRPWDSAVDSTVVAPGGYAIVVGNESNVYDYFDIIPSGANRLRMNFSDLTKSGLRPDGANPETGKSDGELLELVDDEGKVVEYVDYDFEWGGVNEKDTGKNFTLSRIDPYGDANDPSNWESSESTLGDGPGGGGTPGQSNVVRDLRTNRTQVFVELKVFRSRIEHERVLVNEIMYNPPTGEAKHEYVELYNPTDTAIDLDNWSIADNSSSETLSGLTSAMDAREGIVPGKGYALVAAQDRYDAVDAEFDVEEDVTWLETATSPIGDTLHDDDRILVRDARDREQDLVDFQPQGSADDGGGESIERIEPLGPSDMSNFDTSRTDDGLEGTPGRINSRTAEQP